VNTMTTIGHLADSFERSADDFEAQMGQPRDEDSPQLTIMREAIGNAYATCYRQCARALRAVMEAELVDEAIYFLGEQE
jgi:hypothetical protein